MSMFEERREGFALSTTIVALVVIGLLVTGGFFAASQEGRISASSADADLALRVAEHGINTVVGTWAVGGLSQVERNGPRSIDLTVGGRKVGTASVEARRLADRLYFITSTGRVAHGKAERKLGMLVRTFQMEVKTDRAMSTFSPIKVTGHATVSGQDVVNPAWSQDDCPESQGMRTGIVARDTSLVDRGGSGVIEGNPPKDEDASITRENLTVFGAWDVDDLIAKADVRLPPGANPHVAATTRADGTCDVSNDLNWGAPDNPAHACHYYFPIIYAEGDLNLESQGRGQGILIVEGNLGIRGGFEFTGIIIVRGKIDVGGGNSTVYGSVIVLGERTSESSTIKDCDLENGCSSTVNGTPVIQLSTCAIDRAVRYNSAVSRLVPVAERSWVDLTASGVGVD